MLIDTMLSVVLVSVTWAAVWRWHALTSAQQVYADQQLTAMHLSGQLADHLRALTSMTEAGMAMDETSWTWEWDAEVASSLSPSDCRDAPCSPSTWQRSVLSGWRIQVANALPRGTSRLRVVEREQMATIEIRWARPQGLSAVGIHGDCPQGMACFRQSLFMRRFP